MVTEGEKIAKEAPSWRDSHQACHGGQYLLFDGSAGRPSPIAASPFPFFKPGVESILHELEKPPADRNAAAIAASAAMLDAQMLSTLRRLPDDAARLELLAAYDPRFGRIRDDMARDLLARLPWPRSTRCLRPARTGKRAAAGRAAAAMKKSRV